MDLSYSVASNESETTYFKSKEKLIYWIRDRFGIDAALKVSKWKDDFEGRELGESYIDDENGFAIMSTM